MRVTYISNMRVRIPETKRKKERKRERGGVLVGNF